MHRLNDRDSTSKSVMAAQHYEQALLMICDGRVQEAVQELEQACQLQPGCEVYQETLAQLKISCYPSYAKAARSGQHGSGVASMTITPNTQCDVGNSSHSKKTTTSHVNGTPDPNGGPGAQPGSKQSSPIDGLSHIDLPGTHQDLPVPGQLNGRPLTGVGAEDSNTSLGVAYSHDPSIPCPSAPMNAWNLPGVSHHPGFIGGPSFGMDHSGIQPSADGLKMEHSSNEGSGYGPDQRFDDRFLEQLCNAREDDEECDKYYHELLDGSLNYDSGPILPNLNFPVSSSSKDFSGIDDFDDEEYFRSHLGRGKATNTAPSNEPSSVEMSETSAKADEGHDLHNTTWNTSNMRQAADGKNQKERVYFVNGTCYTSSNPPKTAENRSTESPTTKPQKCGSENLSQSERDFYKNIGKYYFGSGKVKYKNEMSKEKQENPCTKETQDNTQCKDELPRFGKPGELDEQLQSSGGRFQSSQANEKMSQRTVQHKQDEKSVDGLAPKDHMKPETNSTMRNSQTSESQGTTEAEATKGGNEQAHESSSSTKTEPRCDTEKKLPVNRNETQNKVHRLKGRKPTFPEQTGRRHKARLRQKGKVPRSAVVNSPSLDQEVKTGYSCQYDVPDESTKVHRKQMDHRSLHGWLQKSGKQLITSCGQIAISVFQYMMVLVMLLTFGFLIFPLSHAWHVTCDMCSAVMRKGKGISASVGDFLRRKIWPVFAWLLGFIIHFLMFFGWFKNRQRSKPVETERINLSMTGDEAVRKMLNGKDKDPYSILSVARDASEDDIRKHYRKLAVLIHPDKNDHPQADEAFKVLADAFAQIGTTEKRMEYDMQEAYSRQEQEGGDEKNSPRNFFSELHKHMTEMQNFLSCDACGGKHRRYKTDRSLLNARFCSQCETHHTAKQGELWAESKLLGMKFYFFARIDDAIYDVTEWAACHGLHQGRIKTDSHVAPWKIKTQSNQRYPFQSEEELMDDFLREMFFGRHFPPGSEKPDGQHKSRKKKRKKRR